MSQREHERTELANAYFAAARGWTSRFLARTGEERKRLRTELAIASDNLEAFLAIHGGEARGPEGRIYRLSDGAIETIIPAPAEDSDPEVRHEAEA